MATQKERFAHKISLRPRENKRLIEYCKEKDKKPATVLKEIIVLVTSGELISKGGRNFFDDF